MGGNGFLAAVERTIQRHQMLARGDLVLVAVSGGPDSVALLYSLWSLRERYGISLEVVHLNHRFRGEEAEEDARFVEELAGRLGLPVTVRAVDVPAMVRKWRVSPQVAGRRARYSLFFRLASEKGARRIALGHNRDDQAETLLMRLLRGSGLDGLSGIPPVRAGIIIRPLIETSRAEIEDYLRDLGVTPRRDPSNLKPVYMRNRIRLHLLPVLRAEYNPRITEVLAATAEQLRDDAEYVAACAEREWPAVARRTGEGICLSLAGLAALPAALQRRVLRKAHEEVRGRAGGGLEFAHVEAARDLALAGRAGAQVDLPGWVVARRDYEDLILCRRDAPDTTGGKQLGNPWHTGRMVLNIPGETVITEMGYRVRARLLSGDDVPLDFRGQQLTTEGYFDYDELAFPLWVRYRQPGDRFHPLGVEGSKKLKDFFIDKKVRRDVRDRVPVVACDRGIVWVVGYAIDGRFRIRKDSRHAVHLEFIRLA